MAEAHNAIAFSFSVGHEGVEVNVNHEAIKQVFQSGLRSQKKKIHVMRTNFINNVYPVDPESWLIFVSVVLGMDLYGIDVSFGWTDWIQKRIGFLGLSAFYENVLACLAFSLAVWWLIIFAVRYSLQALLSYRSWMYEAHGKVRLKTKIWLILVRLFGGRHPRLMSYQKSLPKLPVPSVKDTVRRYLDSVRPLLDDVSFTRMQRLATDFQNTIGNKLNRYLILKSWWATNYVTDWWEEYVYLRGRSPIMINANYYGVDALLLNPTPLQTARAAKVVHVAITLMRDIQQERLPPLRLNSTIPLCSYQYDRQFATTRIPGIEQDQLLTTPSTKHITVYHRGRYFKLYFYTQGKVLTPAELEVQMEKILADDSEPCFAETELAALTAGDRTHWAQARNKFFSHGVNKNSLDAIEKAAFHLVLEDEEQIFEPENQESQDQMAARMLHGKAYDRWFDKSFTLVVCKNGRLGFNAEHSWADAPIMSQMWSEQIAETLPGCYRENGHTLGEPRFQPPDPIRLKWNLEPECKDMIDNSLVVARQLIADIDIHHFMFRDFGKGLIKKYKLSPDAFMQLALQLANFKDQGRFSLTYEASMTRLFREGRTETVRSCTQQSCDFVRSMLDSNRTNSERRRLLQAAADRHQQSYRDAMSGRGVDRHLFCLYVVSKYLKLDSPFLKEVLSEPWHLSTSQTPHQQTDRLDLKKHPDHISGGGGFGPVVDDGYGISYIIAGEDTFFFHISSKRSCDTTDSHRMGRSVCKALHELANLFDLKPSRNSYT